MDKIYSISRWVKTYIPWVFRKVQNKSLPVPEKQYDDYYLIISKKFQLHNDYLFPPCPKAGEPTV